MKLLVTGGLGHIGSKLIRDIRPGQFAQVDILDNLMTQRYASLFDLPAGVPYHFIEDDILTADLSKYLAGVDVVVHLAAITNAEASVDNPEAVERTNFLGTRKVAEACAAAGARMVFLSTTSVYGVQEAEVNEDCPLDQLKPQSPYADSKLKAEFMLKELAHDRGLRFIACRFGTIFGISPGMRFHTAVNKFVWQACNAKPLSVWSAAIDQKRPYLDLKDAVRALFFILEHDLFDGRIYNIVTANATVRQVVEAISKYVPDVRVEYVHSRIMNQLSYTVSPARFQGQGFRFEGSLDKGIGETVRLLDGLRSARLAIR